MISILHFTLYKPIGCWGICPTWLGLCPMSYPPRLPYNENNLILLHSFFRSLSNYFLFCVLFVTHNPHIQIFWPRSHFFTSTLSWPDICLIFFSKYGGNRFPKINISRLPPLCRIYCPFAKYIRLTFCLQLFVALAGRQIASGALSGWFGWMKPLSTPLRTIFHRDISATSP